MTQNKDQGGAVAIVVSVIIMVILTLVAISFAQLMRREERQALDRQLNSQAYYAAESAINDAVAAIKNGGIDEIAGLNRCKRGEGALSAPVLDDSAGISYSCVTVDMTPGDLVYEGLSLETSSFIELRAVNGSGNNVTLNRLKISWEDPNNNTSFRTYSMNSPNLPSPSDWNSPGMVRVEIIPLPAGSGGLLDRAAMLAVRKVFYLYPAGRVSSPQYGYSTDTGSVLAGSCNATNMPRDCSVDITNLPGNANYTYVLRMRSIYKPVDVTVTGTTSNGGAGSDVMFGGAQYVIDATGKAADVLRRIRAHVSLDSSPLLPEYVLQSFSGVCKEMALFKDNDFDYNCFPE